MKKLFNRHFIFFTSIFIFNYFLYFYLFLTTIKYRNLFPTVYWTVIFVLLIILLGISLMFYESVIEKNNKLRIASFISIGIITLIFSLGSYYLFRINSSVDNVIVSQTSTTNLDMSFVVYEGSSISDESEVSGHTLGILSNSDSYDNNSFVKTEIEDLGLNITYIEFSSYNEMLLGLFNGLVDVIAVPSDYVSQFETNEGYGEYLDKTRIIYDFTAKLETTTTTDGIDVTKKPITVLIMGNDGGRTDSLILTTFNPLTLDVTMTSIPRDSFVPIACYPNEAKDKIGHAFSVSRDCAIDTVENLLDVSVDYYVVVNFQGVVDIVDALDKIWVVSPLQFVGQNSDEERGHYTVWIPEGGFWATGEQALAFARERYLMPGGDYTRQENQQQVIASIIDKTLQLSDVNKAINVLDAAGQNIKTNMSLDQMIDLFNLLIKAVNKTGISPRYILEITGSQIKGYASYTYNEEMQLPLWISKPYEGSIADLETLINSNLNTTQSLPTEISTYYNAIAFYSSLDYFSLTYNEKETHEVLPDFMPSMSYNDWTLEKVRTWAASRGISLTVNEIREGNANYNTNYVHNYVISQSVRYGIKTSTFNKLTIGVIKHELDCKIEANMVYDECKYKLPDFVGDKTKLVDVVEWANSLGVKLSYVIIPETDSTYDKELIGYVIKQNPSSAADVRTLSELILTIMDPNYSITIPTTTSWTKTDALTWVSDNLSSENNYVITNVATTDSTKVGKVVSTTPATGNTIKYKDSLQISVYALGFKLSNYVGIAKETLVTDCASKFICTYTDVKTSDSTLVGKVANQSIAADTLKTEEVWKTTTVNFGIYVISSTTDSSSSGSTTTQ